MPWNVRNAMSLKEEFVSLARQPDANIRELCRRFSISPQSGYKWLRRFCSGLMKPDTHLGENARNREVSDDQATSYLYP
ncbi:transposase [Pseudomonas soli]|uniref:transposase n=1 Tax=Pseudomonas soli TaxID=1306993 RepID=UPI003D0434F7